MNLKNVEIKYLNRQTDKINSNIFRNQMDFPKEYLAKLWNEFDFKNAEEFVFDLQCKLANIAKTRNMDDIRKMQDKITNSIEAKMLAVKKISDNFSSAGIDKVRWRTDAEKMDAAIRLNDKNYESMPLRNFVLVDRKSGKQQNIGVPTLYDRAMHYLYAMALEPVAEVWADYRSFGFRKGRSAAHAHAHLINALNNCESGNWILVADVQEYYGNINHDWLLHNIPMNKNILSQFLRSGTALDSGELFPTEEGISLGCSISPILGNMTLDGIQKILYDLQGKCITDYKNGWCIRYADDIIVLAKTENDAKKFKEAISSFLEIRGLKLSNSKTKILNLNSGDEFTFLARTYYKKFGIVHCKPSIEAQNKFKLNFGEMLFNPNAKWTPRKLVAEVNQKLNGWAAYHRITEAKDTFMELDTFVSVMVLRLIKELYPKLTKQQIINRFYWKASDGKYNFALSSDRNCRIINLVDTVLIKAKEIDVKKNYYIDNDYFNSLEDKIEIENVTGRYKELWNRQLGKCAICGKDIQDFENRKVIFNKLSKDTSIRNMMYIHSRCEESELVYVYGNLGNLTPIVTMDIINEIQNYEDGYQPRRKTSKFEKLKIYFQNSKKENITLTFRNIENILGFKLCKDAYTKESYYSKYGYISRSWSSQNYELVSLNMKKQKLSLKKCSPNKNIVDKPIWLDSDKMRKLPLRAITELNEYLQSFERKYRL